MCLQDWYRVQCLFFVLFVIRAACQVQVTNSRALQTAGPHRLSRGIWASWSSWTSCSSTCGVGAAIRTRRCLQATREDTCQGEKRQYKVCQLEACPANARPFRDVQCSVYNYKSIPGTQQTFEWVPFYGAASACELNCLAVGHNFYYTFGRVLDGTTCGTDSGGICINGQCLKAGCDGILGSESTTDLCGKCGGNNDSCFFIQNVYHSSFPSSGFFGYKNVTRIPAGARQIKVTDQSRNFLALMNANRHYVINGDWSISWPGVYKVAGTLVNYSRTADNHEVIEAAGPTKEDIYILVLFQEQNPGIKYEFWMPKDIYYQIQGDSQALVLQLPNDMNQDPLVHKTLSTTQSANMRPVQPNKTPSASSSTARCGKCKNLRGKSQRIKHYCQSDFVLRAMVLGKRLLGHETRYDILVKHAYKNKFPIVHREYIWVSNICDCPQLLEQQEYLIMASRHVNYEHTLNRILLSAESYVRPWSPREDQQLQHVKKRCTTSP
ncbi:ADAMTS-like protein 5 isoform X2 [Bombina bombina]|uniref:ADAMTS-like protein 5 isoform X2 n=1 Tax=Bombina bombina TaxID=8345 RepID=UPI00235A5C1D|nr:ADAMTS-like protein 5 isoform X2 [Bombina bombina]